MRSLVSAPLLFLMLLSSAAQAVVVNGDFSVGLTGWMKQGDVSVNTEQAAVIGDTNTDNSALYQGVALTGRYRLDFDLNGSGLSSAGQFLDVFSASILFHQ